jgi:hypothetical protein
MERSSIKDIIERIPKEKKTTRELLRNISCEEFEEILEKYEDISDIYNYPKERFIFFKHIDSAFPEDSCEKCQVLFIEKSKEQESQHDEVIT